MMAVLEDDMNDLKTTGLSETATEAWVELVRQYVASLRFGSVTITVRDGQVVEVVKTEKRRFGANPT